MLGFVPLGPHLFCQFLINQQCLNVDFGEHDQTIASGWHFNQRRN